MTWFTYGSPNEVHEANYLSGKLNGAAKVEVGKSYKEKTIFNGVFRDNLPNGYGVLLREGNEFAEEWVDGCLKDGIHSVAFFTYRDSCDPL